MNRASVFTVYLTIASAIGLAGCDSSTGNNGSTGSGGSPATNSRFGVSDSLLGRWKGIAGTSSALDTVTITKDSMSGVWTSGNSASSYPATLKPYLDSKFYAHTGRMGYTNGMTVSDNVTFEYLLSGDTLWVEYQITADPDGQVVRSSSNTHAWLRR